MSLPVCAAFVGRAAEVSALLAAYRDPAIHTVLIAGEPGLGKSRLVTEFTTRLATETVVLVGRCPEVGIDGMPFAPFVSVIRALLRQLGIDRFAELLPVTGPALARWLPELAARAGSAEAETDRIRLFGEILTVLEQLAMRGPVVVLLEDLHWADTASRELLGFLVANAAQRDLLLVGTYRPADSPELRRLVTGWCRDPGVRLVIPEPLTRHEVGRQLAALLGREPEPGTVARIFERSKGIPLFVEALSNSTGDSVAALSDLLLGYQAMLPPDPKAVLRLAAVAGSPVRHTVLAAATELDEDTLHGALRRLIEQQLLTARDTGYEFRHMLIRDAVYGDLLPAERKQLHARLSRVLTTEHDPDAFVGELAYHANAAGDLPRALEASWRAAAAAEAAYAHGDQVHHLQRVLDLWARVPDATARIGTDRLTVLEQMVAACYRGSLVEPGTAAADEALALVDAARTPSRAAALLYHRAVLQNHSSTGCEHDLLRALKLLTEQPPTVLRGELLAELAAGRAFGGDPAGAEQAALAAVAIAEELGAAALAARAYAYLGLATADRADTSVNYFEKAHAYATDPQTLLTVAQWESTVLVTAGAYAEALAAIQQGLRAAHETFQFVTAGPILLAKWTQALTALGRWPEALALIEESLTGGLPPLGTAALLLSHAKIVLAQGDSTAATTSAETADELLSDGLWARQYRIQLRVVQCAIAIDRNQPGRAAEIAADVLSADDLAEYHHEVWPLLVAAAQLPELPTDSATIAGALPVTSPVDAAHRAVHHALHDSGTKAWYDAASAWRALQQPYELSRSLLHAAKAELAVGNRSAAQIALREVADLAAELPAAPLAETTRGLADRAGLTLADGESAPATARPTTFGLTPRELEVLRLVAKGLSNRQIAGELFISGNTAGVHVSRILTKLGAATRTEAAAVAHTHGLLRADGA